MISLEDRIQKAAVVVSEADAVLIGAGAGMGVDSGLPSFRGADGFWNAYPPYRDLGLSFSGLSNPRAFQENATRAWGFYGHRLSLYRETKPHDGFGILRKWVERASAGYFVFSSNVDGHFQKAGFHSERIEEHHGSIHHLQCRGACHGHIFSADQTTVAVDESTMLAEEPLPSCDQCGAGVRPNILMFYDAAWVESRTDHQHDSYERWLKSVRGRKVVVIEIGAGKAIPTVREECQRQSRELQGTMIRINIHDSDCRDGLALPLGGLEALSRIDDAVRELQR